MNESLADFFKTEGAINTLRAGLPYAFELAEMEAKRVQWDKAKEQTRSSVGQEVGVHRERVIHGFLISQLGEAHVTLPAEGASMVDALVFYSPLEIKTATQAGSVTAKWTSDNASVADVLANFKFLSDMLLIRIWWERDQDSVFYIPVEVLNNVASSVPDFLSSATGTNNRGVKIKKKFMDVVEMDKDTIRIPIKWQRSGQFIQPPIVRYIKFWTERAFPDQGIH